jgi:hypothetical protein
MMDAQTQSTCPAKWPATDPPAAAVAIAPVRVRWPAAHRRLAWLLVAAWIVNLFDLGLTMLAWRQNLMVELNPLAAQVLPHGPAAIVAYKLVLLLVGTASLWYCRRHWATEPAVWAYVLLCIGLSFWWRSVVNEMHVCWAELHGPNRGRFVAPEAPPEH